MEKLQAGASRGESLTGQAPESASSLPGAPQAAAAAGEPPGPSTAGASSALIASLAEEPTAGDPDKPSPTTTATRTSSGAPAGLTAGGPSGDSSCEISGLGGPEPDGCGVGGLGARILPSLSPADLATRAAARAGAPPGGGYGGSASGSRSVIPPPGPAPSGAFSGSAAGGSGIALSGFFTLAGLLLLAAPRAMRRLRLSCRPWLTTFFVLIPERPG